MKKNIRKMLAKGWMIFLFALIVGLAPKMSAEAASVDDLTYTINNGAVMITDCDESASGELVIPAEIDGYPVTTIQDNAFYCCTALTSVEIPKGVTSIGMYAFYYCPGLTEVVIPESVKTIGDSAFRECANLTSIAIPEGVKKIDDHTFRGCTNLSKVTLPESLTWIGNYAFADCKALTDFIIPENVTTISRWAFDGSGKVVLHANSEYAAEYAITYNISYIPGVASLEAHIDSRQFFCMNEPLHDIYIMVNYYGGTFDFLELSELNISGYDSSKSGCQEITFEYQGKKLLFTVWVEASHDYQEVWVGYECSICGEDFEVEKTEIKQMPYKTEYCLNTAVDSSGLILTIYLDDGTVFEVSEGFYISEFDSSAAGVYTIYAVSFNGAYGVEFEITIHGEHQYSNDSDMECDVCEYERTVSGIEIVTLPSETEFCLGEECDFSGLVLKVVFSDDSSIYIQDGFATSGFSSEQLGNRTITVQYEGKQTTFDISICNHSYDNDVDVACNECPFIREVTSIEVMSLPLKTVYCFDEAFDYRGLIIKLYYSDGTTGQISEGYEIEGVDSEEEGSSTIYLSHSGKYTSFNVSVVPHTYTNATDVECNKCGYIRKVTAVNLEGVTNKTVYCIHNSFDYDGCQLHVVYDDGSSGIINSGFTVSGFDSDYAKKCKVILSYQGFDAEYEVKIVEHTYSSDTDDACDVCDMKYCLGLQGTTEIADLIYFRIEGDEAIIVDCYLYERNELKIPSMFMGRKVTKIAPYAFKGCLCTNVILPDSIVSIGEGAFYNSALEKIIIPEGVTRIEKHTFMKCNFLQEMQLPETLTYIGDSAFYGCLRLDEIVIPKNVTNMHDFAFGGAYTIKLCVKSLYAKNYASSKYMTYEIIPETLTIKTLPSKIKYSLNEEFCIDGLILEVFYDNTREDILTGWKISGFDSSQEGICIITVEYGMKVVSFEIEVHDYKTIWNSNGENHWHECAVCGDKVDIEKHTHDNACDTTCNICGKERTITHAYDNACDTGCNVCGEERTITHAYKAEWTKDKENHWHECAVCEDKTDMAKHVYDDACDTTCNICGKERTTTHAYKTEWTKDEENHWHECAVCEDKTDIEKHEYDNACDIICNVCKYKREHVKPDKLEILKMPTKSEYRLGEEYSLEGLILIATYFDGSTEIITSGYQIDGMDSDEEGIQTIWVVYYGANAEIDLIVHDYETEWSVDETNHWHDCKFCDSKVDIGAHIYGNWQVVTPATTSSEGLEKHSCTICGHEETRPIAKLPSGTWKNDGTGWWYQNANGTYPANCWKEIDNVWYYFNASGYILTGWQSINGTWYYFNGSGAMLTGWQSIGGTWYYFNGSGAMVTGWQSLGGTWYYFNASGAMATGWLASGSTWYYFNAGGAMVTGWQEIDGAWYYFEGSGAMVANRWVGNYYLQADGSMATNKWIGSYYVGADGVWIP